MGENDRNGDRRDDEDRTAARDDETAKRPEDEAGVEAEPADDGTIVPGSGSAGGP